jgi:tetratricopeptide (TPR) repeat protein
MQHFQEALRIGPKNKETHAELNFKIGRVHQLRNQDALAMTAYRQAIDLAPENTRELRLYCSVYDRLAGAGSSNPEALPKCLISNR